MTVTLTLTINAEQASRVLQMLAINDASRGNDIALTVPSDSRRETGQVISSWTPAQQFRELLRGRTEQLVSFVIEKGPEFFNDDLAAELKFENPAFTSSVLGKITGKLRRVGVRAEGHKHTNWYTTHNVGRRTLLRVRPDVLEFFEEAMA